MTPTQFARKKTMDLLAVREHSEKELRLKLRAAFKKSYSDQDLDENDTDAAISEAIAFAQSKKWMAPAEDLAEKTADVLHRRKKGIAYINQYLEEKGLPAVTTNPDLEFEKAWTLAQTKFANLARLGRDEKQAEKIRLARFLAARGFDEDVVARVTKQLSTLPNL